MAAYVGRRFALAVPHGTLAVHLALLGLDIGPGDEVIVADVTWIGSAAPVVWNGATPVFADIDPVTWCVTPDTVARCISERTKAIIAVDLYGNLPDYDGLLALADAHGIPVIEDAAEALGTTCRGRRAGSFGDISILSFAGNKTITTSEGGMVLTDDPQIYSRMIALRDHGRLPGDPTYFNKQIGYRYRMSDLQAALGLAQMDRIDELLAFKRCLFDEYAGRLAGYPSVRLNAPGPDVASSHWMVVAMLGPEASGRRDELVAHFAQAGIDIRPFFFPLSFLPAFGHLPTAVAARERNTVAHTIHQRGFCLPSGYDLDAADVERVVATLAGFLARLT